MKTENKKVLKIECICPTVFILNSINRHEKRNPSVSVHRIIISGKTDSYFVNIKLFVSSWANTESDFKQIFKSIFLISCILQSKRQKIILDFHAKPYKLVF